ncbi:MAG: DUF1129 family protein [Tuberibacillus sp.]
MTVQQLIEENNQKRKQLTKDNEEYYSEMLVYLRFHFTLSERHTEELLMELLDHLLDGQAQGKSAQELFGDDPKAYCDEMIEQLPKESKRNVMWFGLYISLLIISIFTFVNGIFDILFSFIKPDAIKPQYYGSVIIRLILQSIIIGVEIGLMFAVMKRTAFQVSRLKKWLTYFAQYLILTAGMVVFLISYRMPGIGPEIKWNRYFYVILGILFYIVSRLVKKKSF